MTERKARDVAAQLETDLGAGWVVRGVLHYPTRANTHAIAGKHVDYLLERDPGREVLVVILCASEWAPTKICAHCSTVYVGAGCMACADEGW
jgi:hypothetical protein